MLHDLIKNAGPDEVLGYGLGALAILCGTIFLVTCVIATNWRKYRKHQLDCSLKQDMLDRGMTADEIERVMGGRTREEEHHEAAASFPTPSDVVVEWEGDWYPALLLKSDGSKYYVHYKGYDEEEWVTLDRIRFPAQPQPATVPEKQGQLA